MFGSFWCPIYAVIVLGFFFLFHFQIGALQFPPKRFLGNRSEKVIQKRRTDLEVIRMEVMSIHISYNRESSVNLPVLSLKLCLHLASTSATVYHLLLQVTSWAQSYADFVSVICSAFQPEYFGCKFTTAATRNCGSQCFALPIFLRLFCIFFDDRCVLADEVIPN